MANHMVAFLGNPGTDYRTTRHNAAWRVLESPVISQLVPGWGEKFRAQFATVTLDTGVSAIFLRPRTFMNRVGESVGRAMAYFKLSPAQLTVVHDDTETPFGSWKHRQGGGLAGHNGLRSVAQAVGSNEFGRFMIGIGRPAHGALRGHVLGRFTAEEEAVLEQNLDAMARDLLEAIASR